MGTGFPGPLLRHRDRRRPSLGAATGPPDHACMMVTGWGVRGEPRWFQRGAGRSPAAKLWGFLREFHDILRCFHWIGPWMLVGPMGVPHVCTIILGGYLPVRLVGDIAYSNHCGDS